MSELRLRVIGTVEDVFGEEVEVAIQWNAGEDAAEQDDEARVVIRGEVGGDFELDQAGAEKFAQLFVSACWEAARQPVGATAS
jgi:hypothetical protein